MNQSIFSKLCWCLALILLAIIPAVIFPGDAPFINDEPQLLQNALNANNAGALATHGLMGSKGVRYGPLPTWIYQLMLLITHDPVVLVILHAVILAGTIAVAVYGIACVFGLWPWFAAVLVVSPYLWYYERHLWDNSFNLAFTALALFSYGAFLAHRSRIALTAAIVLLFAAMLVHTMSIAFVVPMAAHMVFFERRALWQNRWGLLIVLFLLVGLSWRYWSDVAMVWSLSGIDLSVPFSEGFLFAFTGARLLGATGLGCFYTNWDAENLMVVPVIVSYLPFLLSWVGALIAAVRIVQALRHRSAVVLDHLGGIALATVIVQALLDGFSRTFGHPHYHNATWIAHAVLTWITIDVLVTWRVPVVRTIAHSITMLLVVALTSVNVWMLATLHTRGGTRPYHITLSNQLEVIRDMGRYPSDIEVQTSVPLFEWFPHTLRVLRILAPPPTQPVIAARKLLIRYRSIDPADAHVEVVVAEHKTSFACSKDCVDFKVGTWGPHSMTVGDIPNKQPNGYLGIWIQVTSEQGIGEVKVLFDGQPFNGYVSEKLITTGIPPSQLVQPGKKEIVIKQVSTGKTFPVGTFVIDYKQ